MAEIRDRYDYVIVGGGVAADKAARAIRKRDEDASIAIFSDEADEPVYRPELSKGLWFGDDPDPASQALGTAADTGAEFHAETKVTALRPDDHEIEAGGATVGYGKLLLATGAGPKTAPGDSKRVLYLRNVADYRRLREAAGEAKHIGVVGGGFIAGEVAAALSTEDLDVTLLHPGERALGGLFPASISKVVEKDFADHGVALKSGFRLKEAADDGDHVVARGADGEEHRFDYLVAGLGATLNTKLAREAGLELEGGGVAVDESLQTSAPDVYAAGDIATFTDPVFGRRGVAHQDNAEKGGTAAGSAMTGEDTVYERTPMFFADLFDNGYEAVGRTDTRLHVIERWNDERTAAVVFYTHGDGERLLVDGVLTWNTFGKRKKAAELARRSQVEDLGEEDILAAIEPAG
ncbi:NAD(P)/FAD-dependent oxidoreductase [Corynebacterium otitidis]|uniref:FAD-dependent pyridine nucleotide-disulfide oxidoreductase n=1 Tax=Corynebacterium otitidis ATCC 51513 TaxID=883169 RepID=I7IWT1_9CORY|nr:FAD/NAD(P)-binding oxidoreductase [Corynebacterium otitidis]EJZ82004.1 hypothetical protein HMPREF9719_01076 [Corynebacterium otitidis ATCC 51513]KKO83314.1 pyridine nucleotide-disulfide oxidoreductase [Corynebacterium otitidis]CCI83223.1 FAD-dependent pyridine nucleotide-disulfide oxidoreductase [Corynebacterium otitidis ATCC 51513]